MKLMSTDQDASVRRAASITAEHDDPTARTPFVVVDLAAVRARYHLLSTLVPGARVYYAVKANPAPQVITTLVRAGSGFDVASRPEIELCLRAGADAADISYGSTVKKCSDIAFAHERGVRRFAFDSLAELHKIAENAPGSDVYGRLRSDGTGSVFPLDGKFGSPAALVADLLLDARRLGLNPVGVSFHVGSQQLDPYAWAPSIAATAEIFERVAEAGIRLEVINLGGGLPATYDPEVPPLATYGLAIDECLGRAFGADRPEVMIEPGRAMVADAGTLHSEVVLVSRRDGSAGPRWVYLDIGRFGGLAETEGELIHYPLRTAHDGQSCAPVVLAGPTCDSADVLYRHHRYLLPECLRAGDRVQLLCTGAYTVSYSSVGFNGFGPLTCRCVDSPDATGS